MEAFQGLRQRGDERNGEGVGIAEYLRLLTIGMSSPSERAYCHGSDKIGLAFLEAEASRDQEGAKVGDDGLDDENQRDDGEISQFFGRELRPEFCEDCRVSIAPLAKGGAYSGKV